MTILKVYFDSDFSNKEVNTIISDLGKLSGVEKVVKKSEDMSVVVGLTIIGLALQIASLSTKIILKIRDYLKNRKIDTTLEFKCNDEEITIKGNMTTEQIKKLFDIHCR